MQMLKVFALVPFLLLSNAAFAIVDGSLQLGMRSSTFDNDGESETIPANEIQLSVHVDPIPLIPVAAGLYYLGQTYKPDNEGDALPNDSYSGSQIGIRVMAWIPLDFYGFEPYAKLGYSFYGKYDGVLEDVAISSDLNEADVETAWSLTGVHYSVGLRWSFVAVAAALIEVDMAQETLKLTGYKFDGDKMELDDLDVEDIDVSSYSILLGLQVGI